MSRLVLSAALLGCVAGASSTGRGRPPVFVARCTAPTAAACGEQLGAAAKDIIAGSLREAGMQSFLTWTKSTAAARNLTAQFVGLNTQARFSPARSCQGQV